MSNLAPTNGEFRTDNATVHLHINLPTCTLTSGFMCKADFDRFKGTFHNESDKNTTVPNEIQTPRFRPPATPPAAWLGMSHFVTDSQFFVSFFC
jgi:hypothetical protein